MRLIHEAVTIMVQQTKRFLIYGADDVTTVSQVCFKMQKIHQTLFSGNFIMFLIKRRFVAIPLKNLRKRLV